MNRAETGWTLQWPRDVTLIVVAALTVLVLLGLRRLCVRWKNLRLLIADEHRLRVLRREARLRQDFAALERHRRVRRLVAWRRFRLELLPALAGILPAWLVITWGAHRLEYVPLRSGDPFEVTAILPASTVGRVAHAVPDSGLTADNGWIQVVEATQHEGTPRGVATWQLRTDSADVSLPLVIRHGGNTYEHPLEIGGGFSPAVRIVHGDDVETFLNLAVYRPFGVIPEIAWLGLRPWLVGLLALTLVGYVAGKGVEGWLRIEG